MNSSKAFLIFLVLLINFASIAQKEKKATKLRRADCFFGIHFDLHASEDINNAGKTLTNEMIDTFLTRVQPDFIQIDCKGHPGISSYPTKVGFHVKGFDKDPLKLFREVTEKNKVALFMHFSGVWDGKVVKEHPDWAIVKSNGQFSKEKTSFFSPYLDKYMIPQLKELSDYKVDGAWIDGECWAVEPDYGKASLSRFTKETGIKEIPKKPTDKYYPEFIEYNRKLFREHLNKYIDAVHQYNPDFQITSNWAYSSMMPEKVTINVDYLSGDVTPQNGVYRSAFEARCLAPQGKPWDLMAWGFSWDGGKMPMCIKSTVQLQQEAAQIMAMGGGVQFYFQQNKDLSIIPWLAKPLSEIAGFCRQRQQFCHKSKAIPQIALLYPTASYQKNASRPYSNNMNKLEGTLNLVLDGQNAVEILMEHHLMEKMDQYPIIIIPECDYLEPAFFEELKKYVTDGGHLMVIGTETSKVFEKELGIKILSKVDDLEEFIAIDNKIGAIRSSCLNVELLSGVDIFSNFYLGSDFRNKGTGISSSTNEMGKGLITGIYFDAGSAYQKYKSPILRDFINFIINKLFPNPIVKVTGSRMVHLTVNQLNGKLNVNLINVAGEHTNQSAIGYDEIPTVGYLTITIKTEKKPSKIILQPEGKEMEFIYQNGSAMLTVQELKIHSILEIMP